MSTIRYTRGTSTIFRRIQVQSLWNGENVSSQSGHCKQKITRLWNFIVHNVLPDVKEHFPRSRYRVTLGILRSIGNHSQKWGIRESMRRTDFEGVLMRSLQLQIIHRRRYSVYVPKALWHVDTSHKLSRSMYINACFVHHIVDVLDFHLRPFAYNILDRLYWRPGPTHTLEVPSVASLTHWNTLNSISM